MQKRCAVLADDMARLYQEAAQAGYDDRALDAIMDTGRAITQIRERIKTIEEFRT
jgi:uncharacterized protein (UPF0335 family)